MCSFTRYWQTLTRPLANTSLLRLSESESKILTLSRNFGSDEAHFHVDNKIVKKWILVTWEARCGSRSTTLLRQDHTRNDHWATGTSSGLTSSKTSAATRRPSTLSGTGRCWRNFGGPSRQSRRTIWKPSSTRGSNRTVSSSHCQRNPGLATGAPRRAHDVNVWDVPLTIQLLGLDPNGILSVGSLQFSRIPDQLEEPLRHKGGGEISGRLCTPSAYRPKAEAALRRAKLCLKRNGGHREHVLGAPRQSASGYWICSQRKYNWTGFHLVPDSRLDHQYNRKDASFKFVWLFWDTQYVHKRPRFADQTPEVEVYTKGLAQWQHVEFATLFCVVFPCRRTYVFRSNNFMLFFTIKLCLFYLFWLAFG